MAACSVCGCLMCVSGMCPVRLVCLIVCEFVSCMCCVLFPCLSWVAACPSCAFVSWRVVLHSRIWSNLGGLADTYVLYDGTHVKSLSSPLGCKP